MGIPARAHKAREEEAMKIGDKVLYIGTDSNTIIPVDGDDPEEYLIIGQTYRITYAQEHVYHTDIFLDGYKQFKFISSCFRIMASAPQKRPEPAPEQLTTGQLMAELATGLERFNDMVNTVYVLNQKRPSAETMTLLGMAEAFRDLTFRVLAVADWEKEKPETLKDLGDLKT